MKRLIVAALFGIITASAYSFDYRGGGGGGTASDIESGVTTITGGTDTDVCFDDGGIINCADDGLQFNKTTNVLATTGAFNAKTGYYEQEYTNNTSTGTTTSKPVKNDGTGKVVVAAAATDAIKGICVSGCGTSGTAVVATSGSNVQCVFGAGTTANDYVTVNASGECVSGGSTFPTTGSVIGTVNTTNGGAGTYGIDLNGPDVASVAAGGGGGGAKNPAGSAGYIQYRGSGNFFAAEAAFTYDAANNRQLLTGGTSSADGTLWMLGVTGTLPANGDTGVTVVGVGFNITSAGTDTDDAMAALSVALQPGATGSANTNAAIFVNSAAGTGSGIASFLNTANTAGNLGIEGEAIGAATTGTRIGIFGEAEDSTATNVGAFIKAVDAVAGSNIGILANAANSTEATDLKNVAILATLNSSMPAENKNAAVYIDGGTFPDANTFALRSVATFPSVPGANVNGWLVEFTGAGSASQAQFGIVTALNAGYTGSSATRNLSVNNASAGTGNTLGLNGGAGATGNIGASLAATGSGTGLMIGGQGVSVSSTTGMDIGLYGQAGNATAATKIGVLGNAASSSEGTDFKNVGGYFTTRNALTTGVNVSVALIAENGSTEDIFRAYDAGTLVFSIQDGGGITTTGGAAGQSVTASVRDSGGSADCNLVFTNGLLTSTTC